MNEFFVCGCLKKVIPEIADALNGPDAGKPVAITLGGATFYFVGEPGPALRAHEAKHREQARRCDPWWMPIPSIRMAIGDARFLTAYIRQHRKYGYRNNPYEIEARAAEDGRPTVELKPLESR